MTGHVDEIRPINRAMLIRILWRCGDRPPQALFLPTVEPCSLRATLHDTMAYPVSVPPRVFAACPSPQLRNRRSLKTRCARRGGVRASGASSSDADGDGAAGIVPLGSLVLVVGATGGVGQLAVAKLLEAGYSVRAAARNEARAKEVFGDFRNDGRLEIVTCDLRDKSAIESSRLTTNVAAVVCALGTTAFPSARWKDGNGPEATDFVSVKNLVECTAASQKDGDEKTIKRFVLISSVGVDRTDKMPFLLLNLGGVLRFKKKGEDVLKWSNVPYTILRPGRLTDGPYTSYDINTLLKATSDTKRSVTIQKGDELLPQETSRIVVADAVVASLRNTDAIGNAYVLATEQGAGPGNDQEKWDFIFGNAR
jgi:uncharacterized protein YbjT (DUF2867 family)